MGERDRKMVAEGSDLFLWKKVKECFWSCIWLLIYASLLGFVTLHFHIRNLFPFWYVFTKSSSIFFFRIICSENNQMAAVMLQLIPSFYTNYSKNSLFISANTCEKFIVSKEDCIARHDDKMCFLPNCRYHIILLGNIKDWLQKLDAYCFLYQHVDCLYILFKYHFSGKFVIKNGQFFDNLQRAVHLNQQSKGVDRMPSISKKRLLRKKYKKHLLSSFQRTKSTETSGSVFADRIEQVKKTKFELELIKFVDCFLDGYGKFTTNLLSFKTKSL